MGNYVQAGNQTAIFSGSMKMDKRSWMLLEPDPIAWQLPDDLRARDQLNGVDCGWVNQMRPFIQHYSKPGDIVLDPFCGFATTLLAAGIEGRKSIGFELDTNRAAIARERLARHHIETTIINDSIENYSNIDFIDLCITNLPYFGCHWQQETIDANQLYRQPSYADYLHKVHSIFYHTKKMLKPDSFFIVMAENLTFAGQQLPLAWDISRILNSLFIAREERLLCYQKPITILPAYSTETDRSHEYALIFQNTRRTLCLESTQKELKRITQSGFHYSFIGSFATWRNSATCTELEPSDADILITRDQQHLDSLCQYLISSGYALSIWSGPVMAAISIALLQDYHYLRAERIDPHGRRVCIDISLENEGDLLRP
jgi:DNA methylase